MNRQWGPSRVWRFADCEFDQRAGELRVRGTPVETEVKPLEVLRSRYLFSGLTKCGQCGGGFSMGSANRLTCFGARDQGTCTNRLTIRRDEVEARVLRALQDKLLRRDLFEEFCEEFTRKMNRLRMEHRASLTGAERELDAIVEGSQGPR